MKTIYFLSPLSLVVTGTLCAGVIACSAGSSGASSSSGGGGGSEAGLQGTWDVLTFGSSTFDEPIAITIQGDQVTGDNSVTSVAGVLSSSTISGSVRYGRKLNTCTFSAVRTAPRPATVTALDGDWDVTVANCRRESAKVVADGVYQMNVDGGTFKIHKPNESGPSEVYMLTLSGNTIAGGGGFTFAAHRR